MKKRRKIAILPSIQHQLIKYAIFIFLFSCLILYLMLAITFAEISLIMQQGNIAQDTITYFTRLENQVTLSFSVITLLGLALIYYIGLKISHKIVGPFYRIQMHFDEINQQKHCNNISFREKDLVEELAPAINQLLNNYRKLANIPYDEQQMNARKHPSSVQDSEQNDIRDNELEENKEEDKDKEEDKEHA